ncbi:MAG: hypothetical protein XD92_1169 [Proteiniphilum acetatigenes]|jgi:hypothetical protein|uniref:Uncharacterized protein n=1 Tax=Proteiniphilum acetatigenes TaxID=294710 RepID=A0A117LZS1_9BACT|nr:MAG: hypothetical protein XD92_1169 [Proteiniphilum acetatigenes]
MNIIFTNPTGRSLQAQIGNIKTKKGGKYEDQPKSAWARYILLAHKMQMTGHLCPKDT